MDHDELANTLLLTEIVLLDGGREQKLPSHEVIRFGRLQEQDGEAANEVVLEPSDPTTSNRISRWHFELHRRSSGFML